LDVLDRLNVESFHLCAHSMGGLVGMEMSDAAPKRVRSFVNMEGNLTPEDCFFSGRIVEYAFDAFEKTGRREFEEKLSEIGRKDPAGADYEKTFRMASTVALYRSARHMVDDSSLPLADRFAHIRNACYIYGERNRDVYPGEKLLRERGVPLRYVDGAGHNMATDNPADLYRTIAAFVRKYSVGPVDSEGTP
jgi:pimeloyl-ACP methyl ester carboxylesterase